MKTPQNQPKINNANNRTLVNPSLPQLEGFNFNIVRPQILTNNFELKFVMFQMLQFVCQFNELSSEDPTL